MGSVLSTSKPVAPATVPTDTIIPLNTLDDTNVNKAIGMNFGMRFDDVLDPEKLSSSLEKLLQRKDWGRLGARLRLNPQTKKLEYHIPAEYTPERPSFIYSHVNYDISINEHPVASKIPRPTPQSCCLVDTEQFASLLRREDGPIYLEHYIYRDEPQLSLHIVSFTDATIVSLNWLHTLLDAMGRAELLAAWTLMLQGRENEIKPFCGIGSGELDTFGSKPTEKLVLEDKKMTGWAMAGFALRFIFENFWYRESDSKVVVLPAEFIKGLKKQINEEVAAKQPGSYVSEGDVVSAYMSRLSVQQMVSDANSNKEVAILNAFGLRSLLTGDLIPKGAAYIGNAVQGCIALVTVKDLLNKPLSHSAYAVRRSLIEQGTREQQEAFKANQIANKEGPLMYGSPDMKLIVVSNWTKGKFFEVDFSAAVVKACAASPKKIGRPSGISVIGHTKPGSMFTPRNTVAVYGRDLDGNVWLVSTLRRGFWEGAEKELRKDVNIQ
ncbi:transcriptional regulator sdnM [Podospora fimiseda]|uniref:Transcriptional regulator sdnM n=1 Tax=Podospora fimiseda TaxID=252190 RepID=A0AAN6YM55_9PEZI|nr:transcriptional regulator sdnM [Podospora fimiseda]